MKIHKNFKLNGKSFNNKEILLNFVEKEFKLHYPFLVGLLNDSNFILASTSGSTGTPKKINIEKNKMLHSAEATGVFFDLPAKTKALHCLSSEYIAGKMMWVRSLYLGWHIDVIPVDSNPLKHTAKHYDFAAMVPLQVQQSLANITQISKLIIGGAPISFRLKEQLLAKQLQVFQTYGMTETITHVAVKKVILKASTYKALPNVEFSIDTRNCLVIDAPKVTENILITNDVVRLLSATEFEWQGRYDNVINSGGIKLFPEKIEEKLAPHLEKPCIITSLSDEKLGDRVVLLIESNTEIENLVEIMERSNLSKFEKPKEVHYLPTFVRTENGKIKRAACVEKIID